MGSLSPNPETYPFYNQSKTPITGSILQWFQDRINDEAERKLKALQLKIGPHQLTVPIEDHYILFDAGSPTEKLIKIDCVDFRFDVIEHGRTEMTLEAEEIVEAILKDFPTGELQHVKHVDGYKWEVRDADGNPI